MVLLVDIDLVLSCAPDFTLWNKIMFCFLDIQQGTHLDVLGLKDTKVHFMKNIALPLRL